MTSSTLSPASTVLYARARANAAQKRHRDHVMTTEHCLCANGGWCERERTLDREAAQAWLEVEVVERYAARRRIVNDAGLFADLSGAVGTSQGAIRAHTDIRAQRGRPAD